MATSLKRAPGIIPKSDRLEQRQPNGNLTSVHEAALLELAAGNLTNAWALLQEALGAWLLSTWREHSGKPNSKFEPLILIGKLRSGNRVDSWSFELLKHAIKKPGRIDRRSVDTLAAIVRVFAFDAPAERITQAEPIVETPADDRDARQVEQWLPVPTVEPAPVEDPVEPAAVVEVSTALKPDRKERYEPTEAEIERACRTILMERYPSFPLREREYHSPHWREHESRLAAIGVG